MDTKWLLPRNNPSLQNSNYKNTRVTRIPCHNLGLKVFKIHRHLSCPLPLVSLVYSTWRSHHEKKFWLTSANSFHFFKQCGTGSNEVSRLATVDTWCQSHLSFSRCHSYLASCTGSSLAAGGALSSLRVLRDGLGQEHGLYRKLEEEKAKLPTLLLALFSFFSLTTCSPP